MTHDDLQGYGSTHDIMDHDDSQRAGSELQVLDVALPMVVAHVDLRE